MVGEWRGRAVGEDVSSQRPVAVPGRPDDFAGAEGVTYVRDIDDPRDPSDDVAVLVLRGLYAHATVEVTGDRLEGTGPVEHDAYFAPLRLPFRPNERDELVVTCRRPRDRFGGLHNTDTVPETESVPGIWWECRVETHPLPYVDDLRVRPEVTEEGARLHVRTTVVTGGPLTDRITYSLKPEGDVTTRGTMRRGAVETDTAGKTTVTHTVEVRDPALWWPRSLGKQHRYTLQAKLGESVRTITTGIRSVEREEGRLRVNGRPLLVRGVSLLTADPADVERAQSVNANLVRAHAHALPPSVYEACDEAGMVVWQDLPLTGPGSFDVERGQSLTERLLAVYGHHPSLGVVGIHDEPTDGGGGLDDGLFDRLRSRLGGGEVAYDRGPADRVASVVGDGYVVVPVIGGPGVDHDAGAYYPGWESGAAADIDTLLDRYPTTLLAAFGAGARAGEATEAAGFDAERHATRVTGGVEASQAYQAAVLRTVASRVRDRRLGAIAVALRDTDAAGMGVYAVDGTAKRARDTLATAFEPLQALLIDPSPGESELVVLNDRPRPATATLAWTAGEKTDRVELTVDAVGRWTDSIDVPGEATRIELSLSDGTRTVENTYDLS